MARCQEAGITIASNKLQVGEKLSFAGYIIDGQTQYADPKKMKAITKYPLPNNLTELRG